MKQFNLTFFLSLMVGIGTTYAQTNPIILSWLQNTTQTGSYYMSGNSTAIGNNILVNCQKVEYSNNWVFVHTKGIPAYPTGPFMDGNPSQATDQDAIFRFPLTPTPNTGTLTTTTPGNIGIFINGVALFDYRDGVAWNNSTGALCGGPGNPPCPGGPGSSQDWNRDAIPAEMDGFDCSKGHPAMGNYHHHQNPSAFKLDQQVVSSICNLYDADGLYVIDSNQHSPLIGFAYDGYPIYGAYGYANNNGTGGIVRIKSSYQLKNITTRTNGPDVDQVITYTSGPPQNQITVNDTLFLGYFREDYEYVAHTGQEDFLDEHNGRFCVTPEYPNGTYAYFATVDENWNSAYPYVVGPNFYGEVVAGTINSVNVSTTVYTPTMTSLDPLEFEQLNLNVFPNPTTDLIAIQATGLVSDDLTVELIDIMGKVLNSTIINKGQTVAYFDVKTVYNGTYFVKITNGTNVKTEKIVINR